MNFNKFINSDYLKSNPLCGIDTYKDELNLATGACTRNVYKYEFTGRENWAISSGNFYLGTIEIDYLRGQNINYAICSHYPTFPQTNVITNVPDKNVSFSYAATTQRLYLTDSSFNGNLTDFKTYLTQQYTNGTPVTVWYVLKTPTTETITVPSGLSGTEEGYLNQSGTPTPTNPIYPTANTVEKWHDIPHYIHNTSTDTITTLPAVLYPTGTTATVGLKGNMNQSGAPTPSSPVTPSETGDLTGNLFDKSTVILGERVLASSVTADTEYAHTDYISIEGYTYITVNKTHPLSTTNIYFYSEKTNQSIGYYKGTTAEIPTGAKYVRVNLSPTDIDTFMLNTGSTALPYEPYGYKIPISSANTITPVYLGEVESTRRIKKIVFDGTEDWTYSASGGKKRVFVRSFDRAQIALALCSHFDNTDLVSYPDSGKFAVNAISTNQSMIFGITDMAISSATDWTTYLTQQYAAGTPVTVWYVLATPETAVVNEPLRKIGDYADEVSGITIPTMAGANTLSIGTTVQPSEVTINYKGWHPVAGVHERENGAWT